MRSRSRLQRQQSHRWLHFSFFPPSSSLSFFPFRFSLFFFTLSCYLFRLSSFSLSILSSNFFPFSSLLSLFLAFATRHRMACRHFFGPVRCAVKTKRGKGSRLREDQGKIRDGKWQGLGHDDDDDDDEPVGGSAATSYPSLDLMRSCFSLAIYQFPMQFYNMIFFGRAEAATGSCKHRRPWPAKAPCRVPMAAPRSLGSLSMASPSPRPASIPAPPLSRASHGYERGSLVGGQGLARGTLFQDEPQR